MTDLLSDYYLFHISRLALILSIFWDELYVLIGGRSKDIKEGSLYLELFSSVGETLSTIAATVALAALWRATRVLQVLAQSRDGAQ